MQTTYRLKPNLTWHDGQPLTADDFVFAYQIYTAPGMGQFTPTPQDRIADVKAPDPNTFVVQWKSLYPGAGGIADRDLDPLPRHILERPFTQQSADAFSNLPFWTSEYVGAGPYRLANWISGISIEGSAFDGHVLGRPKIDRVIIHFVPDQNTMLTDLLAGNMEAALDNALTFEQAAVLQSTWDPTHGGTVLLEGVQPRFTHIQYRPDYMNPTAFTDLRVRRALASSVDKGAIIDGLFHGANVPTADQFLPPAVAYFNDLEAAVTKYPYDLRQTEQLMNDAGYRKGSDGIFVGPDGVRLAFQLDYGEGALNAQVSAIMSDGWHHAGYDVAEHVTPAQQSRNGEVRATFPALSNTASGEGEANLGFLASNTIPSPANRWHGNNRGGWSSPAYDQLWAAYNTTLDRPQQVRQVIQMMQLATADVADIFLFFNARVVAYSAAVSGPHLTTPEGLKYWNLTDWTLS